MTTTTTFKKVRGSFFICFVSERTMPNRIRDFFVIIFFIFSTSTSYVFYSRMESFVFQQGYPIEGRNCPEPLFVGPQSRGLADIAY
jgi:hypothetical protein